MQELSFDFNDQVFEFEGWRLSLQIITFQNVYGLDAPTIEASDGSMTVRASRLTWAGGQQTARGGASVELRRTEDGIEAVVEPTPPPEQRLRCTKLILRGLPDGELIGHRWNRAPVTAGGTVVRYPESTHTALVFLALPDGEHLYFESHDDRVRAKRFTVVRREDGITVELIHEDAGYTMDWLRDRPASERRTPAWRIGRTRDPAVIVRRREAHVTTAFGIEPWESRTDVPAWMRDVSLVIALHGMHWTGYVFNTYDDMRDAIDFVADRIDGRRVLAFLPGWEGRYYWQYGDYRPEPRLGGIEGFARLAARARERGVHLMPMFGANCVHAGTSGFAHWGEPAELRSPSGLVFQGNRPDWDTSRAHDPGRQVWLNPGAPSWRSRLVDQVSDIVANYSIPAVFFDTQQVWINDAQYDVYEGLVALRNELRARFPGLLVTGEGWYDALGAVTPVSHTPAHIPAVWPEIFSKYNRCFLHLSAGDPSRGSSGVHEAGHSEFAIAPDEQHMIPTLTVVDGTIARAPGAVERVIAQGRAYAERWL